MNYIQYMKPGGNFGNKLKGGLKKFLKVAGEASRMAKDARVNNPGAAMIRDAYAKGDEELAKLLTDEMQAANLTGIALGSGAAPLITGFTVAPVTTGATLATGMAGGMAGMYGTDKAINYFSDGKYTGWGDWVNQATNGVIGENTAGVFHPGAIFGGAIAGAVGNKIVSTTNRGKLESLNSELNKLIESSKLNKPFTKLDVLDGYLFHNGHVEVSPAGYNGEKYTYILREAKPGALKIEEGKYKSVRQPYGDNPDLIWWDAEVHNYGKKVYVTKLGNDAIHVMSNMEDLPISQVIERYEPSYYVTKLKPVNSVIEYTFDPISGAPIPHMPGKVLNNKMSYEEILTHPVLLQSKTTPTKTSLAFFERLPAKVSEAERLGISKGDRGNLSASQQEAVRDLYHYITDGKFKLKFLFDAETNLFFWGNSKPTPSTNAITTIAQHPQATIRLGDDGIGYMRIPTESGTLTYFPHLKTTSHTISFPKSEINPQGFGEAAARAENLFGKSVILTSPKTDAIDAGVAVEGLSSTVPKRQVYDFYKQLALTSKPGTYVTGDAAAYPLGHKAIVNYVGGNSTKAIATILSGETPTVTAASRTGLSPDSYISLLRSAQRPEWKLSFNRKLGFGKWNNSAVNNSDIYNAWKAARNGSLEDKQAYIKLFNDWVAPYGGAPAYLDSKGVIIHPHPFIVRQKSGGSIKSKNKNKGKFAKVRDYVDYKNNK